MSEHDDAAAKARALEWLRLRAPQAESVTRIMIAGDAVTLGYRSCGMNYTAALDAADPASFRAWMEPAELSR